MSKIRLTEGSAPSTPPTSQGDIYIKTDGILYFKNDGGTEYDLTSGGGETNTASNAGAGGVGVWARKTGVDLEFKNINAGSNKITILDDTGNDEIDIDVNQAQISGVGVITSGTWQGTPIALQYGGLGQDVSAGDGYVEIKSGSSNIIKTNHSASTNPTTSNDSSQGYEVGSRWINTTADREYVCLDATTSAAVWIQTTASGTGGSSAIRRYLQCAVYDWTTSVTTGDGKFYSHIPNALNGMNLVEVHAEVIASGVTGTLDIQLHNATQVADMLSTKLTIDSGETGSDTAATPAVIDTANDDVAENDVVRVDIDAVQTTAPQGLIVTMGFETP